MMKTVLDPGLDAAIEFRTSLFKSGLGYSAMNTARSDIISRSSGN